MKPAPLLVVLARLLDTGVRGRPSRGWELKRWQSDCAEWRVTLRSMASSAPREFARELRELADLLHDPYSGEPPSPGICATWRDRLHELAASPTAAYGGADHELPGSGGANRFLIASDYRLRVEIGERGKRASGAVADAWRISDAAVRVYASQERQHVDRLMAATLSSAVDDRTGALRCVLAEVQRRTPMWRYARTPRRRRHAA